jgi:hypothetical protein
METGRTRVLAAIAIIVVALAALAPASNAQAGVTAPTCHGFADMPRPIDLHSTLPRLYVWGEFHCTTPASLAVQVCGIHYTPAGEILDEKVVWCIYRIVKVKAGVTAFVRTPIHNCTPGKEYVSYIRIIGQPWARGPWMLCRTL